MAKRTIQFLIAVILLTGPLYAADNAFTGKWKLDPSKSVLTDQMKVSSAGPNRYSLNFSGDNVETITADGTYQPALFNTTIAIFVRNDHQWKLNRKSKGHIQLSGLWQLSADGKTLTDDFTSYNDDGAVRTSLHYIYQRTAGSPADGFVGTWESTTEDVNSATPLIVSAFEGDGLSFDQAGGLVVQTLHFDGKDYPGSGPDAPAGYVSSGHRINDHNVERVDKINGKTLYTQQIEVSHNGKTLTMTVHIPGRDKPDIMVFNRE
jgi:hypothetical protein